MPAAPAARSAATSCGSTCGWRARRSPTPASRRPGCGALTAAASACVELVRGAPLLDAARVGSAGVAAELGGLSAGKLHAADLAADALARALGAAAVAQARDRAARPTACWSR